MTFSSLAFPLAPSHLLTFEFLIMGRRALRKLKPDLELGEFLRNLVDVPKPFDAEAYFGRRAPLEIEVGSGKGLFLLNATATIAEHNFLGLEIAPQYARYCAARLARREQRNGRVICGDAQHFFREWLTDHSAAAIHIYFPDPWWKKRHKKRRVLNESFVQQIERGLQSGGQLHFWTDVEEYFHATLELLAQHTGLLGPRSEPEREPEHDFDFRTNFERRCRLDGQTVYRAWFERR